MPVVGSIAHEIPITAVNKSSNRSSAIRGICVALPIAIAIWAVVIFAIVRFLH